MSLRDLLSCSSQHINPSGRTKSRPCTWLQVATAGQTGRIQPSAVRSKIQQTSNTTKWDILPLRRPVSRWGPDRHGSAPPSWYEADGPMWRPPPRDARCWLKSEPVFLMGGCLSMAQGPYGNGAFLPCLMQLGPSATPFPKMCKRHWPAARRMTESHLLQTFASHVHRHHGKKNRDFLICDTS